MGLPTYAFGAKNTYYASCFDYCLTLVKSKPTVYLVLVVFVDQVSDLVPQ